MGLVVVVVGEAFDSAQVVWVTGLGGGERPPRPEDLPRNFKDLEDLGLINPIISQA